MFVGSSWIPNYYMNAREDTVLVSRKDLQESEVAHSLMKNSTQLAMKDPAVRMDKPTRHWPEYIQKCLRQQTVYVANGKRVKMS